MLSVNCKSIKNIYYATHTVPPVHPLPLERHHIARSVHALPSLSHTSTDIQGQFVGLCAGRGASISAAPGPLARRTARVNSSARGERGLPWLSCGLMTAPCNFRWHLSFPSDTRKPSRWMACGIWKALPWPRTHQTRVCGCFFFLMNVTTENGLLRTQHSQFLQCSSYELALRLSTIQPFLDFLRFIHAPLKIWTP